MTKPIHSYGEGGDTGCGKWDYRGEKMWEVGLSLYMLLLSVLLVVNYQQHHKYINVVVVGVVGRILPPTTTS